MSTSGEDLDFVTALEAVAYHPYDQGVSPILQSDSYYEQTLSFYEDVEQTEDFFGEIAALCIALHKYGERACVATVNVSASRCLDVTDNDAAYDAYVLIYEIMQARAAELVPRESVDEKKVITYLIHLLDLQAARTAPIMIDYRNENPEIFSTVRQWSVVDRNIIEIKERGNNDPLA